MAFSTAGSASGHVPTAAPVPLLASAAGGSKIATAVVEPESPAYKPWTVRRFGSIDVSDSLPSRRAAASVRKAIRAIVEAEGPVHQERLAKLACAAFSLNKSTPNARIQYWMSWIS